MGKRFWSSEKIVDFGEDVVDEEIDTEQLRPTHQQIADRARKLWEDKSCPIGRDEEIWLEAEAQLREEAIGR